MSNDRAVTVFPEASKNDFWRYYFPGERTEDIRDFAKLIGDFNPIHHDPEAAKKSGLAGIVVTGVRIFGFVSSTIGNWLPGVRAREVESIRFLNPLYADTPVTVECVVVQRRGPIIKLSVVVKTESKDIAGCLCTVVVPQ
jgi:acyl dehydratase